MTRVVLVGGGHSHVEVLRQFGADPVPGVQLVLISPARLMPFSGMIPGLIAGHYRDEDAHIALDRVAQFAGAQVVLSTVEGIDHRRRCLLLSSGEEIGYDLVSLDIGSVPIVRGVPGAERFAIPAKPLHRLLEGWETVRRGVAEGRMRSIVIVGGGAAGVELALAMHHGLATHASWSTATHLELLTDAPRLTDTFAPALGTALRHRLERRGIEVSVGVRVVEVHENHLLCMSGERIPYDVLFWVTGAQAFLWPGDSGLAIDTEGFVQVDATLRSVSHREVFAVGDCASLRGRRTPKSGVYAVRQGPVLARNLRAELAGRALEKFVPQRDALALISTGSKTAVAVRGRWSLTATLLGGLLWRWKDRIDRSFLARYNNLPVRSQQLTRDVRPALREGPMRDSAGVSRPSAGSRSAHLARKLIARGGWWVLAQVPVMLGAVVIPLVWGKPFDAANPFQFASATLAALGILLALAGLVTLGRSLTPFPQPLEHAPLRQSGVYGLLRHPIYGGFILASLGWSGSWLSLPGLVFCIGVWVFFDRKSTNEEALLHARYPEYKGYMSRVRKLLPGIY